MKQNVRRTKMMLILPVLVVPFLTMGFWALGGGKGSAATNKSAAKGLNLHLPDANLKEGKAMDKLAFYDKADEDSLKRQEYMRSDPYYKNETGAITSVESELEQMTQTTASKFKQQLNTSPYEISRVSPEKKVLDKLTMLEKELGKPVAIKEETQIDRMVGSDPELAGQVDRLESMMDMMNNGNTEDPEIRQLDGTLDKILDIQHPARVKERLIQKRVEEIAQLLTVSEQATSDTISKGFYGLDQPMPTDLKFNAIEAVVHENQTLVNGAVIKLRLQQDIYIGGEKVPKGNFAFGMAMLADERLIIEINFIRHHHSIYPVKLEVYDMDGLPGIYSPGAISRDVAKQSADNSLQLMEMSSLDPSFKAQTRAAGIGAVKNLFSKKIKLVKVMVKAGYKILLKDKSNPS